jgi:hypothetical protein
LSAAEWRISMEDWPHAIHLASPQPADTASSGGQECDRYGRLQARILAGEEFLAAVTGNPESVESAADVVSGWLRSG